ncbi:ABC transporter substrate-binding protein [Nocardia sp. NPDC003963]
MKFSTLRRRTRSLAVGALAAMMVAALAACSGPGSGTGGSGGKLVIAEPAHSLGYLPLYVARHEGFFDEAGPGVEIITLQGGGAHTNAVLTGQAWAFIGGPEHNAFAAARGGGTALKSIVNVVNRGNVYLVADKGQDYTGDLASFLRGKKIATGAAGGTPHSITMYLLAQHGLENGKDVTLIESADPSAALAAIQRDQADIAVTSEPVLGQGITQGIWGEPFYNVPLELGPYAYSTINVREQSLTEDPEAAKSFIRALRKGLELIQRDPEAAIRIAEAEFPTMDKTVLVETVERAIADELWEWTGAITPDSVETNLSVVRAAGILEDSADPVGFDDVVDIGLWEEVTNE